MFIRGNESFSEIIEQYLVPKCLSNLGSCKWKLITIVVIQILEVYKNALRSLRPHISARVQKQLHKRKSHKHKILQVDLSSKVEA